MFLVLNIVFKACHTLIYKNLLCFETRVDTVLQSPHPDKKFMLFVCLEKQVKLSVTLVNVMWLW